MKKDSCPQKNTDSAKPDPPGGNAVNVAEEKPHPQDSKPFARDTDRAITKEHELRQPLRHLLRRFYNWMLVLIVLTSIGFAAIFLWLPHMPKTVQAWIQDFIELPLAETPRNAGFTRASMGGEIESLRSKQAALLSRIEDLETSAVALSAPDTLLTNELEHRLVRLENQYNLTTNANINTEEPSAPTISALTERLGVVEQTTKTVVIKQTGSLALVMAGLRLEQAIERGFSYEMELRTAETLALQMNTPPLDTAGFKSYAVTGLPTRAALVQQFNQLTGAIVRAAINPAPVGSMRSALDTLLSIITIRRVDVTQDDNSTSAITARASLYLEAGDLRMAVRELEQLSTPSRGIAEGWLKHATARVAAERSVTSFTSSAIVNVSLTDKPVINHPNVVIQND